MKTSASYLSDVEHTRKKRRRYFFLASCGLLFSALLWGGVYLVLWSPLVRAVSFEVEGSVHIPPERIISFARDIVFRDSKLVFITGFRNMLTWPNGFDTKDVGVFLELKYLTIEKQWLKRKIILRVEERVPLGIWCLEEREDKSCFWFDDEGTFFGPAPLVEGSLLLILHDYSQQKKDMNGKILPERFVKNMFSIFRALREAGVSVKEIALRDLNLQEVEATTYDGVTIYFSLRFGAEYTTPILQSFISGDGDKIVQSAKAIDFRTERRVFYR